MSYGLQISGSHGSIQVDQDYRNFVRVAAGSCSGSVNDISFPNQGGIEPQIFVRPWSDGHYVGACGVNSATNVRLWTSATVTDFGGSTSNPGAGFDYVIYGVNSPTVLDGATYGLQVFDAAGNTAIDSRHEIARIQSTVLIDQTGTNDGFGFSTYPQTYGLVAGGWGLRPWVCVNNITGASESGGSVGYFFTTSGTGAITIRVAELIGGSFGIRWVNNRFDGLAVPFAGWYTDIAVLRRYTD